MKKNPSSPANNRLQPRRHRKVDEPSPYDGLRQILNLVFMIAAVVGMLFYFFGDRMVGTVIILVAIMIKIVECIFRIRR